MTTGNKLVDEISQLNINSIPETWYSTIRRNNYPHAMAILVLWDLLYWYKWTEIRKESSGMVIGYKKKFRADLLQRDYSAIASKFGISKRQAQEIIIFLEELGVLKRCLRKITVQDRVIPNVLFIELVPSKIKEISDPSNITAEDDIHEDGIYPPQSCETSPTTMEDIPTQPCETNTIISTTISTITSTGNLKSDSSLRSLSSNVPGAHMREKNINKINSESLTEYQDKNLNSENSVKNTGLLGLTDSLDITDSCDNNNFLANPRNSEIQDSENLNLEHEEKDSPVLTDNNSSEDAIPWESPEFLKAGMVKASSYSADGKKPVKKKRAGVRKDDSEVIRVQEAYIKALSDTNLVKPDEQINQAARITIGGFRNVINERKRIKGWIKDFGVERVVAAVRLSAQDDFCRNKLEMRLRSIMSEGVFMRLLAGNVEHKSRDAPKQNFNNSKPHEGFKDGKRDYSDKDW